MKRLLLIAHAPSANTLALKDSVLDGAREGSDRVETLWLPPLDAGPEDVLKAQAVILGTPENLGYMSGALKDFFDRCYYPLLEETQALPFAAYIRAGQDGTGTRRAIESITTGLRWRPVQDPLVLKGPFQDQFIKDVFELGQAMAAGLEAGIF